MDFEFTSDSEKLPYQYILGSDEYFIWTNKEKTILTTYGAGTKIQTKTSV